MKSGKGLDILVNIIAPVAVGCFIYFVTNITKLPAIITSYLADGLWAYAFISTILIIWERQINIIWILIAFMIAVCFEVLQHYHAIAGTGDVYDVITYLLFFIIALLTNSLFKTKRITPKLL